MYDILKKYPPQNEDKLSEKRANDIKAAVLSRIKEEKAMKKHLSIKTLSIAAAAAATAAMSAMMASAENAPMSPLVRNDTAITAPEVTEPSASAPEVADELNGEEKADFKTGEVINVTAGEHFFADLKTGEVINVSTGENFFVTWDEEKSEWNYPNFMKENNLTIPFDDLVTDNKAEFYVSDGKVPMSEYNKAIRAEFERALKSHLYGNDVASDR